MERSAFAACDEMRGSSIPLFCPKPRRVGRLSGPDPLRSICLSIAHQSDLCEKAGADLLDIFLTKGGENAMSPPFFMGSPPTRSANPVVNDARFVEAKPDPVLLPLSPCNTQTKFGFKPALTRVEGFDCRIDHDRCRSHRISAMA